ncbi:MAG: T9SS type A sorting domain-containing protein [Bacteroidia bacterium]
MKKILLGLFVVLSTSLYAQNCNPDVTITEPGIYPDQLDTAFADESYDFVIQILSIKDTTTEFGGQIVSATIDSVVVDEVVGLPSGFEHLCEPTRCTFTHTSVGCVKLSGNPTQNQAGVYPLTIKTTAYASVGFLQVPVKDSITDYKLIIQGDGSVSVKTSKVFPLVVYPNPSKTGKYFINNVDDAYSLAVHNMEGKRLDIQQYNQNGKVVLDLSEYAKGVYVLSVFDGKRTYTKRLIH